MTPTPIPFPVRASQLLTGMKPDHLRAVGNTALLEEPLLGLLVSRDCPGRVLLDTLELIPQWVRDQRIILSGFHSPLEQQVLRSVLRRNGRVVKILARGMREYRPPQTEREPLANGNMLVLTTYPDRVRRTTRATALERNRLVLALAAELLTPYVSPGSGLADILTERARVTTLAKEHDKP
ncbi:MAG: DNA-processing protein DprA [Thiocapsa sp. C3-sup]|uniref:DNA-processing protein DprA n=1 Tax=unclassified Thiocapsa TaxID=2641286 RepID=UPI0035AE5AA9